MNGETIETTPEHPFYTAEGAWVPAADLQPGAEIRSAEWGSGMVEKVGFSLRPRVMYNFTVAEAHTYFVGNEQWLVHNDCFSSIANAFDHLDEFQVKTKHLPGSPGNWAKFASGSDPNLLIEEALNLAYNKRNTVISPHATIAGRYELIVNMQYTVGTKGQQGIKIVIEEGGHIVTAYPVNP